MIPSGNNAHFLVRSIEPRDADEVSLLIDQLGYQSSADDVLAWIEKTRLDPRSQIAFVACLGNEVIGWIEISIERRLQTPPFALIGGLVVKNELRGKGIGLGLCECAETWSWDQGVDTLRVTSRSTRTDAHRFYLRDGYREVKTSLVFEKKRPQ